MSLPLEGIRILDLTRLLPGDLATQLLVDLGADVIKVEEPGVGDYLRDIPLSPQAGSQVFGMLNQGKRSVALNLKKRDGQALLYRLLPSVDVVVEQFRPGVASRLGVGYADLKPRKPDLIYCSLSSYGSEGPYAERPGHDINITALSGLLDMNAAQGRPVLLGAPVADMAAGMLVAYAILAALLRKERTGEGSHLDLSLFEAAVHVNLLNLALAMAGTETVRGGRTLLTGRFPSYEVYETADERFLALGAVEEKFWHRFCEVVGREEFKEKHLATGESGAEVKEALRDLFKSRSLQDWMALFGNEDVPLTPVLTTEEVFDDPQVRARATIHMVETSEKPFQTLGHPIAWTPPGPARQGTPPELGQHTREVLVEAGVEGDELVRLEAEGVLSLS